MRFGRSSRKSRNPACTPIELALQTLRLLADAGDLGEQRRGILALALGGADLLRQRVALRLHVLRAGLDVLALALERLEAGGVERQAPLGEPGRDGRQIVAKKIDVEHGAILANGAGDLRRRDALSADRCRYRRARTIPAGTDGPRDPRSGPAHHCSSPRAFLSCSRSHCSFSRIFASRPRSVGSYHDTSGMLSGK